MPGPEGKVEPGQRAQGRRSYVLFLHVSWLYPYTVQNASAGDKLELKIYRDNVPVTSSDQTRVTLGYGDIARSDTVNSYFRYSSTTPGSYRAELYYNGASTPSKSVNFTISATGASAPTATLAFSSASSSPTATVPRPTATLALPAATAAARPSSLPTTPTATPAVLILPTIFPTMVLGIGSSGVSYFVASRGLSVTDGPVDLATEFTVGKEMYFHFTTQNTREGDVVDIVLRREEDTTTAKLPTRRYQQSTGRPDYYVYTFTEPGTYTVLLYYNAVFAKGFRVTVR